jgi:hypothetical protein
MIKVLTTATIVAMSMLFVQVYFTTEAQKETAIYKSKLDSLQKISDSLYAELYPCEIELSRVKTAEYILMKRNPEAYKQLADIISNETE